MTFEWVVFHPTHCWLDWHIMSATKVCTCTFHNNSTVYNITYLQEEARKRGEIVNDCSFNTYSIHCGTEFMERLHKRLQYFICKNQSQYQAWQNVEIILSGHLVSIMIKGTPGLPSIMTKGTPRVPRPYTSLKIMIAIYIYV